MNSNIFLVCLSYTLSESNKRFRAFSLKLLDKVLNKKTKTFKSSKVDFKDILQEIMNGGRPEIYVPRICTTTFNTNYMSHCTNKQAALFQVVFNRLIS